MRQYAVTNKVLFSKGTPHGWDTVQVKSSSDPSRTYTVDLTHGRCSCPAWVFQKGGERKPCKHLRKLGFTAVVQAKDLEFNLTSPHPKKVAEPIDLKLYENL
jgi:hypothetical protein